MIVPVRQSGARPPVFLVHGLYGVSSHSIAFAQALTPDRPFFAVFARGLDGSERPCASAAEMAANYAQEVRAVEPNGPYALVGQCAGGLLVVEIARALSAAGASLASVLLIDPPPLPFPDQRYRFADSHPRVLQQLYDNALDAFRRKDASANLPFDLHDPRQMHIAASVAVQTAAALSGYQPGPYSGAIDLIVSAKRASAFSQSGLPWQNILLGPRRVHVLPGDHFAVTREQFGELLRLMRLVLDGSADPAATVAMDVRALL
ncbi:MAG TPA: alpha/beta fold hydrolase [Stellaceae bacterium]|nr:alpha/beta fold hydrolase [Stellaceae bacterium]